MKVYLKSAAVLGALSVILGAFAAYSLKKFVDADSLAVFETGVRYQFYHVFALFIAVILYKEYKNNSLIRGCQFFIAGIVLFSGSLYMLALFPEYKKILGPITPLGGVAFIAGWIMLLVGVSKKQ